MINALARAIGDLPNRWLNKTEHQTTEAALTRFNNLILEHQDSAFNLASYLLGDPDLAEDITQKAFINAYLHFSTFHGSSFRAWLLKIVQNACYDEIRRLRRHPSYSLDAAWDEEDNGDPWLESHFTVEADRPEQSVEEKEQSAAIHRALDLLPQAWRSAVVLVDLEGLDYREAALATGVPLGTIKSRLARGRKQLGTLLAA
jgi:RNA polymerase sigma-70 factor (ECF subfamily)